MHYLKGKFVFNKDTSFHPSPPTYSICNAWSIGQSKFKCVHHKKNFETSFSIQKWYSSKEKRRIFQLQYVRVHNGVYKRKKLLPRPYCNSTKNIHIEYLYDEIKWKIFKQRSLKIKKEKNGLKPCINNDGQLTTKSHCRTSC